MGISMVSKETSDGDARIQADIKLGNELHLLFRKPGLESWKYPSCRVQKGLIIASYSRELVEEGVGLGLPIVRFGPETIFPGDASLSMKQEGKRIITAVRFATALPLDYLSFTLPYPLLGTALFERVKNNITRDWRGEGGFLTEHFLTFDGDFSEARMKFAVVKAKIQFLMRRHLGKYGAILVKPIEFLTDAIFRLMK